MGEPAEQANVIGIINSRNSDTEYEIPDHEKMTNHGYMKIDTVRNDMSRLTEAKAEETETDKKRASVEKTLAEQTTLLRRLKWICALLTVSIVIISATFGVLIHVMVSKHLPVLKTQCINTITRNTMTDVHVLYQSK